MEPTSDRILVKPAVPPLMKQSYTRLAKPLSPLPKFAKSPCPFRFKYLPQLPFLYDSVLAAIITSEPLPPDLFGEDRQTWDEGKHTLLSLAQRGFLYFNARVTERVQDLAPGPFKDLDAIEVRLYSWVELISGNDPYDDYDRNACFAWMLLCLSETIKRATDMFLAYIGALRVPYRHDDKIAFDTICRLDKYLDDLISPRVWIKLDDLVKARSRGQKFGEQQLLNPQRKTLVERMSSNITQPSYVSGIETQVPSFKLNPPSHRSTSDSARHNSPSLLLSPAPRSNASRSPSIPTGPRRSSTIPTGPRHSLPRRPSSPHTSNSDTSDSGVGPQRRRQRSKRTSRGGPIDMSRSRKVSS